MHDVVHSVLVFKLSCCCYHACNHTAGIIDHVLHVCFVLSVCKMCCGLLVDGMQVSSKQFNLMPFIYFH